LENWTIATLQAVEGQGIEVKCNRSWVNFQGSSSLQVTDHSKQLEISAARFTATWPWMGEMDGEKCGTGLVENFFFTTSDCQVVCAQGSLSKHGQHWDICSGCPFPVS
jgi:hypothetical protein